MADRDPIDEAVGLHADALAAIEAGRYDAACQLASESLELFLRESGPGHPDLANVLNCLATIYTHQAEYAQAEASARRAVNIMRDVRTQTAGADIDRLYVQSLTALGNALRALGRYPEAAPVLEDAVVMAEALGEDDEDLISALNSLGMLCKYDGRFDRGAALYARAIEMIERL